MCALKQASRSTPLPQLSVNALLAQPPIPPMPPTPPPRDTRPRPRDEVQRRRAQLIDILETAIAIVEEDLRDATFL